MTVNYWTAGCFRAGCPAEPRLTGGAVEWARRALGVATRGEAWGILAREFGGSVPVAFAPQPVRGPDFCRFPKEMRRFDPTGESLMRAGFEAFAQRQWGVTLRDARDWGLGWCLTGDYASRVVVPIIMGGEPVGFQARTIRTETEPKYLTSGYLDTARRSAECARPASAMLFNVDAVPEEGEALIVEGCGDVMGWHRGGNRNRTPTAVAILGVALTPEKLALLASRRLERVLVGLDDEPLAQQRARGHVEDLRAWGIPAGLVRWVGAKDAGAGAALEVVADDGSVGAAVRLRLGLG